MLSQTAAYALRAVIHLARDDSAAPVRVDDVAEAMGVPRNYLSKILHVLARDGVLDSTRGPGGGFRLVRAADELSLAEIVAEFDSGDGLPGCLLGHDRCGDDDPCAAHACWRSVSRTLADFFENTTVADLVAPPRTAAPATSGEATPPPDLSRSPTKPTPPGVRP